MRLHHLALWSRRIELLRDFYTTYFDGRAGEKYETPPRVSSPISSPSPTAYRWN